MCLENHRRFAATLLVNMQIRGRSTSASKPMPRGSLTIAKRCVWSCRCLHSQNCFVLHEGLLIPSFTSSLHPVRDGWEVQLHVSLPPSRHCSLSKGNLWPAQSRAAYAVSHDTRSPKGVRTPKQAPLLAWVSRRPASTYICRVRDLTRTQCSGFRPRQRL